MGKDKVRKEPLIARAWRSAHAAPSWQGRVPMVSKMVAPTPERNPNETLLQHHSLPHVRFDASAEHSALPRAPNSGLCGSVSGRAPTKMFTSRSLAGSQPRRGRERPGRAALAGKRRATSGEVLFVLTHAGIKKPGRRGVRSGSPIRQDEWGRLARLRGAPL
jgi:hypothetical protein